MLDPLFVLNLETNLILYFYPGNLKFYTPFKINIQKREGLSYFEKPIFDFSVLYIQKRVD